MTTFWKWALSIMLNARIEAHNPFETTMMLVLAVTGLEHLATDTQPAVLAQVLSPSVALIWDLLLFGGGTLSMLGSHWRGSIEWGLHLERIGLAAVAGAMFTATAAVLVQTSPVLSLAAPFLAGFGCAAIWRIIHIRGAFRRAIARKRQLDAANDKGG